MPKRSPSSAGNDLIARNDNVLAIPNTNARLLVLSDAIASNRVARAFIDGNPLSIIKDGIVANNISDTLTIEHYS